MVSCLFKTMFFHIVCFNIIDLFLYCLNSFILSYSSGGRAVSALSTHTNNRAPGPSGSRVNSIQNATRTPHNANLRAVGLGQATLVQIPVGVSNANLPPLSMAVR